MKRLHLDTNTAIRIIYRNSRWSPDRLRAIDLVRARYRAAIDDNQEIHISSIVVHELEFGIAKSSQVAENAQRLRNFLAGAPKSRPFDTEDARAAGEIRALLAAKGTPVGPYDVLIAGQALRHGATLVTANARELRRVPGLKVVDWTKR